MATLELSIEDVAVSAISRRRGLGLLFWAAIAWMMPELADEKTPLAA